MTMSATVSMPLKTRSDPLLVDIPACGIIALVGRIIDFWSVIQINDLLVIKYNRHDPNE